MRNMSTRLHAYVDYVLASTSIFSPLLFGFGEGGIETLAPIGFGLLLILYNFFTDYELGLSKQIPVTYHLRLDIAAGLTMILSPWLLRFHDNVYFPHILLGAALLINALLTGSEILKHAVRERR
ncbi:MAG TPA: hypothetical protein VGD17_14830 [Chitinophagaceae bacterium]